MGSQILSKERGKTLNDGNDTMKKAYLHIGLEKTGTTSLQIFLQQNSNVLKENNLEYLGCEEKIYVHGIGHFPIVASFCKECPDFIPLHKHRTSSEVLQALSQDVTGTDADIILSCEHFSSRLDNIESIKALGAALSPRHITIICYLRRQDEQAIAHYSTLVKGGRTEPFDISEITTENRYYNYLKILEDWAKIFGRENIIVREYDRNVLINGNICSDFLNVLDVNIEKFSFINDQNISLNSLQVEMLRCINKHLPSFSLGGSEYEMENFEKSQYVRTVIIPFLPEGKHISALMTNSERQMIMNRLKSENFKITEFLPGSKFIKKWYRHDLNSEKSLFPTKLEFSHFEKALVASGFQLTYIMSELEKLKAEHGTAISEIDRLKIKLNKSLVSQMWRRLKKRLKL